MATKPRKKEKGEVTHSEALVMIPKGDTLITQSDTKTWMKCQQAYHYSRVQNLQPRKPQIQLIRGSILHELIQAKEEGTTPEAVIEKYEQQFGKMFVEERDYFGDLLGECQRMFKDYVRTWKDEPLRYVLVEYQVGPIQLAPNVWFTGKIDGLVVNQRGEFGIAEHKTHKKYPDENVRLSNLQVLIYAAMLEEEGDKILEIAKSKGLIPQDYDRPFRISFIVWDYIRTKAPTKPKKLKNGRLSLTKKIDTDYRNFKRAIIANGEDPKDPYYRPMLKSLKAKGDLFFKRIYLPIQRSMVKGVVETFARAGTQIRNLSHEPTRNLGRDCSWCSFYSLCNAEIRGFDTDFVREAEYTSRELRYSDLTAREEEE